MKIKVIYVLISSMKESASNLVSIFRISNHEGKAIEANYCIDKWKLINFLTRCKTMLKWTFQGN